MKVEDIRRNRYVRNQKVQEREISGGSKYLCQMWAKWYKTKDDVLDREGWAGHGGAGNAKTCRLPKKPADPRPLDPKIDVTAIKTWFGDVETGSCPRFISALPWQLPSTLRSFRNTESFYPELFTLGGIAPSGQDSICYDFEAPNGIM